MNNGLEFDHCLAFTLQEEGGWSDNPGDPGGPTNFGITLKVYQEIITNATVEMLKKISHSVVRAIYLQKYWGVMQCYNLPPGIDLMVFDFGVNAGTRPSIFYLQVVAGTHRDEIDGPLTEAAIAKLDPYEVCQKLYYLHLAHYKALRDFETFGTGWITRLNACHVAANAMIISQNKG